MMPIDNTAGLDRLVDATNAAVHSIEEFGRSVAACITSDDIQQARDFLFMIPDIEAWTKPGSGFDPFGRSGGFVQYFGFLRDSRGKQNCCNNCWLPFIRDGPALDS